MLRSLSIYSFIIFVVGQRTRHNGFFFGLDPNLALFRTFTTSYKNFKTNYFKMVIKLKVRMNYFYDLVKGLFPFYWKQLSRWYDKYPIDYLTEEDLGNLVFLKSLPQCLLAKPIINLFKSPKPIKDLEGE